MECQLELSSSNAHELLGFGDAAPLKIAVETQQVIPTLTVVRLNNPLLTQRVEEDVSTHAGMPDRVIWVGISDDEIAVVLVFAVADQAADLEPCQHRFIEVLAAHFFQIVHIFLAFL